MCGFKQENQTDSFNWVRKQGKTPSSNTGPEHDHTCRGRHGRYAWIDCLLQSVAYIGNVDRITSDIIWNGDMLKTYEGNVLFLMRCELGIFNNVSVFVTIFLNAVTWIMACQYFTASATIPSCTEIRMLRTHYTFSTHYPLLQTITCSMHYPLFHAVRCSIHYVLHHYTFHFFRYYMNYTLSITSGYYVLYTLSIASVCIIYYLRLLISVYAITCCYLQ